VPNKDYRVGIENGNFVRFNEHCPNKYHGYIIEKFQDLDRAAKNALYNAGLIRDITKGKIK
jgi:hypothetical protein